MVPMNITMLLADHVQMENGKLYVLGGGWSVAAGAPASFGIAVKADIPWDRANARLPWTLTLVDADGHGVPAGEPVVIANEVIVSRPDDLPPGVSLDCPLAFQFNGLPLGPGRYEFRFTIDDESASVSFFVRS